jgi:hypothetical protein
VAVAKVIRPDAGGDGMMGRETSSDGQMTVLSHERHGTPADRHIEITPVLEKGAR